MRDGTESLDMNKLLASSTIAYRVEHQILVEEGQFDATRDVGGQFPVLYVKVPCIEGKTLTDQIRTHLVSKLKDERVSGRILMLGTTGDIKITFDVPNENSAKLAINKIFDIPVNNIPEAGSGTPPVLTAPACQHRPQSSPFREI